MNNVQRFAFDNMDIRTVVEGEKIYFCGKDICNILGYQNHRHTLGKEYLEPHTVKFSVETGKGIRETTFVDEPGLYQLILRSQAPNAQPFINFVTEEVLPTIRKHGAYMTENVMNQIMADPDFGIKLLESLKEEREKSARLQLENEELAPKAVLAERITDDLTITVAQLAKMISHTSYKIGPIKLFDWLRKNGWLGYGDNYNRPTEKAIKDGVFSFVISEYKSYLGHTQKRKCLRVTPKGQEFFMKTFKKNFDEAKKELI